MSRYHSIYATQQKRPSRAPWIVAILLVTLVSGTVGGLIARGGSPDDLFAKVNAPGDPETSEASREMVPSATAGSSVVPVKSPASEENDGGSERDGIQAASESNPPVEGDLGPNDESNTATAQDSVEPSESGDEAPGTQTDTPQAAVQQFAALWSAGDYNGMYDLISFDAESTISRQDFVDRYAGIAAEAGLTAVDVRVIGGTNLQASVPIEVEFTSSKIGTIIQQNTIQLAKEDDTWKIAWAPSLIFSQIGDGCVDFTAESVHRGSILDRNGEPLAMDGMMNVIGIIPGMVEDETTTLSKLSKIVGMPTTEIKKKYQDGEADWFMPIKTYPSEMDDKLLTDLSQLKGVAVRTQAARIYPYGDKTAHITGYVTRVNAEDLDADTEVMLSADDWIGRAGLEAGANDLLAGVPGGRLSVVDCATRVEREVIADRPSVAPQNLVLTIDIEFQLAVDAALGDVNGSAVVIDPRNGSILAMASHPTFDPNWFVVGFSDKDWAFVNDEVKRPLLNRALQASYPTGSIFKAITMAAAMEGLGYSGSTEIDCPQEWSIPGTDQIWRDWTYESGIGAQGVLSLHWALVNSCNTVFYQLGNALDEKDENYFPNMVKAFGLGAPTQIPFLAEVSGIVPDPAWKLEALGDYWARGDAVNLSIGQGYLEATPLQMANAYAAIANNGQVLRPFIVEFSQDENGTLTRVGKKRILNELPVDDDNLAEIRSALRDQTSNTYGVGSAKVFGDFGWPIGGKTGTAQNQLARSEKPHAWFAAFGPYGERATVASIVMVENSGEGVTFAAPRTRTIYEAYLKTDLME